MTMAMGAAAGICAAAFEPSSRTTPTVPPDRLLTKTAACTLRSTPFQIDVCISSSSPELMKTPSVSLLATKS